jgi:diadenylate cyclase
VVKGSDIRVVSEKEEFQQILEEHAGVSSRQGGRTKREMVELVTAAVVSLILVAGIWFSFTRGWDTLMTLDVPIEYMNRDPGMEILDTSLNTVTLELSGSGALIRSIRPEQVKVRVDLNRAVAGSNAFTITPEHITLPPGIFLKNIKTPTVEVILDVPTRKELPVQVDWIGKLPEHLIIEGVKMDPERVQVMGGKLALEKISTIYTEKVSVDHIEETGTMTVRLAINAVSLKISSGSKEKIAVHYEVKKRLQ